MKNKQAITKPDKPLANPRHEAFARAYVNPEHLANGTIAYAIAYNIDQTKKGWRLGSGASASKLLQNSIVLKRINYLLEHTLDFDPEAIDKQLAFLINQSSDLKVKLGAIKEYNLLKGRITRKLDIAFSDTSDEQLEEELALIDAELKKAQKIQDEAQKERGKTIAGLPDLTEEQKKNFNAGELV